MIVREEYLDDGDDTITEENSEEESLNPDYDRVSGSGAMPSLDDFLGVDYASDGVGTSSEPFGNVIGDPAFSEHANDGEAYDYDSDDTDSEEDDYDASIIDKQPLWKRMISGNVFKSPWVTNNFSFFLVLALLGGVHIAHRNFAVANIREELRLAREVHELRTESVMIATQLMAVSKVTEVSKLVEARKLGIHAVTEPPMQFVMDKFYRADSLMAKEPSHKYDSEYYYDYQN